MNLRAQTVLRGRTQGWNVACALIFGAIALALPVGLHGQEEEAGPTTLDGLYTEAQAERGSLLFEAICLSCHDMEEFQYFEFLEAYADAPVSELFDYITEYMPDDEPGVLRPQQYADVVAYIFQINGLPTGEAELPTKSGDMKNFTIKWVDASGGGLVHVPNLPESR